MSKNKPNYRDGDTITIEGKQYVIASLKGGGFTLLDASGPGWSPADFVLTVVNE